MIAIIRNVLIGAAFFLTPPLQAQNEWVEVRTPHFIVVSDRSPREVKRFSVGMERARAALSSANPDARLDPARPVFVLLPRKNESFLARTLANDSNRGAGLRMHLQPEQYFILVAPGATGSERERYAQLIPYAILHRLNYAALPHWLQTGLTGIFSRNAVASEKVSFGAAQGNLFFYFGTSGFQPLETFLAINKDSAHLKKEELDFHYQLQSLAFTHYLLFADGVGPQGKLADIVTLLSEGHDSVSAVSNVLGDLKEVQKQLNRHIMRGSFSAIVVPSPPDIPLDSLPVRTLSPAESALLLGRYFLDPGEMELCRHWLEIALRESASNLLAHTLLGRLEYWQGNHDKALAHFDAALRCGSEPHLVYFYRGKLFADEKSSHYSMAKATEDFQRAVQINAGFAPARAALAETYQRQGQNLHEAELLVTRAIEADPANFDYRIILAAIESKLGRWDLAQRVVRVAFALAQTPQEKEKARSLREELAQRRPVSSGMANANHFAQAEEVGSLPTLRRRPAPPRESLQTADGIAANVRCRGFQLEFELLREGETLHFLSENILELTYFRSDRSAPIYFDPCRELRGKTVKVRFKWRSESGISGTVSSIELLN